MLWLILAVLVWGIVHSLLASLGFKAWVRRTLGESFMRFFRVGYNLFSVVSFLPVLWLAAVLPDEMLYQVPPPWAYGMLFGQAFAGIALVVGVLQTGALSFAGLQQLFEGEKRDSILVRGGLYSWVRHPLYSAGLAFLWLTPIMSRNTLVLYAALTAYIIVGAYFEERKLVREFGEVYLEYQATTPMLIPGLKNSRNKAAS